MDNNIHIRNKHDNKHNNKNDKNSNNKPTRNNANITNNNELLQTQKKKQKMKTYKFPLTMEYSIEDVLNIISTFTEEDKQTLIKTIQDKRKMEIIRAKSQLIRTEPEQITYEE